MVLDVYDNYAISNLGRLKNVKTGKLLVPVKKHNGYLAYHLCQDGKKKSFMAHRLVATYFIPNPENKPCVNHIDGDKENNMVLNLEWCTNQENTVHAQENKLKEDNKPILATDLKTGEKAVFYSIGECASFLGTNRGSIHRVLTGKRRKHKNFTFEYCQ